MNIVYKFKKNISSELVTAVIYGNMDFQVYYEGETEKKLTAEYNAVMKEIEEIKNYISLYTDYVDFIVSVYDVEYNDNGWYDHVLEITYLVKDECQLEVVGCFEDLLWWQKKGLMYTTTGYGKKIPTQYMVRHRGRNKRVYNCIFSNSGLLYIRDKGKDVIVEDINLGLAIINKEFIKNL